MVLGDADVVWHVDKKVLIDEIFDGKAIYHQRLLRRRLANVQILLPDPLAEFLC